MVMRLNNYVIRYTRVGSGVSEIINVDSDSSGGFRTLFITGLVAFTNYSIEVAAMNVNGTGPFNDPIYSVSGQDSE